MEDYNVFDDTMKMQALYKFFKKMLAFTLVLC